MPLNMNINERSELLAGRSRIKSALREGINVHQKIGTFKDIIKFDFKLSNAEKRELGLDGTENKSVVLEKVNAKIDQLSKEALHTANDLVIEMDSQAITVHNIMEKRGIELPVQAAKRCINLHTKLSKEAPLLTRVPLNDVELLERSVAASELYSNVSSETMIKAQLFSHSREARRGIIPGDKNGWDGRINEDVLGLVEFTGQCPSESSIFEEFPSATILPFSEREMAVGCAFKELKNNWAEYHEYIKEGNSDVGNSIAKRLVEAARDEAMSYSEVNNIKVNREGKSAEEIREMQEDFVLNDLMEGVKSAIPLIRRRVFSENVVDPDPVDKDGHGQDKDGHGQDETDPEADDSHDEVEYDRIDDYEELYDRYEEGLNGEYTKNLFFE